MNGVRSVPLDSHPVYEGVWHGKQIHLDRVFRGYLLSDEECKALCDGHAIEIHGLERRDVKYAVVGALQESVYQGLKQSFTEVKLKALKTIPYDPEYKFHIVEMPSLSSEEPMVPVAPTVVPPAPVSQFGNGISVVNVVNGDAEVPGASDLKRSDEDFINNFDPNVIAAQEEADFQRQMEQSVVYGTPQLMPVNTGTSEPRYIAVFKMLTQEQIDAAAAAAASQPVIYDPWYDMRSA
jgi:hypothetical protein